MLPEALEPPTELIPPGKEHGAVGPAEDGPETARPVPARPSRSLGRSLQVLWRRERSSAALAWSPECPAALLPRSLATRRRASEPRAAPLVGSLVSLRRGFPTARAASLAGSLWSRVVGSQVLRFGAVGTLGFVVDAGVLALAMAVLGADPYSGRALSFLVAASTTFALNRTFTFRDRRRHHLPRRWAGFLAVNGIGGAVNYTTYALLVASAGTVAAHPVLGVAAGSLAGFSFNFTLSKRLVFAGAAA